MQNNKLDCYAEMQLILYKDLLVLCKNKKKKDICQKQRLTNFALFYILILKKRVGVKFAYSFVYMTLQNFIS